MAKCINIQKAYKKQKSTIIFPFLFFVCPTTFFFCATKIVT